MERVSVISGENPIIVVAPHGANIPQTALIAEFVAKEAKCHAIINRLFEISDTVNVMKDKADCSRIDHLKEDVVYDEFLVPLLKKTQNHPKTQPVFLKDYMPTNIFYIYGTNNVAQTIAGQKISVIVGNGIGLKKDSFTCANWQKDLFLHLYDNHKMIGDGEAYEAKRGGEYSGRDSNCINQYFAKHLISDHVFSMQLTFPESCYHNEKAAQETAMKLAVVLLEYLDYDDYNNTSHNSFFI